jgi:hypothetical protein
VRVSAALAAAIAAAAVGSMAADAAVPRQSATLDYTTTAPGSPTGTVLKLEFQNPEDPSLKPHAVARMVIHRPEGSVIDTTVPPRCHASDVELMLRGPAGCPADTQIGSAVAVSDTGGRDPFPRYSTTTISNFNADNEMIGVGVNDDIPALKFVDRTKIERNTTTTNFPLTPGVPPPEPFTPLENLNLVIPAYVRGGRAYMRTPPKCPAAGYWTATLEFTYRDGVSESVESRSPCQKKRAVKKKRCKKHRRRHCQRRPALGTPSQGTGLTRR